MILSSHVVGTTRLLYNTTIATTRLSSVINHINPGANSIRKMSGLPKTMKAVQIEKTGGIDVLRYKTDVPVPQPKEGEVLVKNEYIGINYIDT
jgi:hypothetical protein